MHILLYYKLCPSNCAYLAHLQCHLCSMHVAEAADDGVAHKLYDRK